MSRLGRYWIFFVIVAVGLALSWGQVGRKAQRVLEEEPVIYLATEPDCMAANEPCAAFAGDRALILGPDDRGLRIRQTGLMAGSIVGAEVAFLAADGSEMAKYPLPATPESWWVDDIPEGARSLRVRVIGSDETTAAEFVL
jgi:hypothetical protein